MPRGASWVGYMLRVLAWLLVRGLTSSCKLWRLLSNARTPGLCCGASRCPLQAPFTSKSRSRVPLLTGPSGLCRPSVFFLGLIIHGGFAAQGAFLNLHGSALGLVFCPVLPQFYPFSGLECIFWPGLRTRVSFSCMVAASVVRRCFCPGRCMACVPFFLPLCQSRSVFFSRQMNVFGCCCFCGRICEGCTSIDVSHLQGHVSLIPLLLSLA